MAHSETAVPDSVRALIGLFDTELSEVKFPDVDAQSLAAEARKVMAAADAVSQAQATLTALEAELAEQQENLVHKAQRALAYARVFAEDAPALSEKLQVISLPRTARRARVETTSPVGQDNAPVRRRGRPPKAKVEGPNLFAAESVELLEQAG